MIVRIVGMIILSVLFNSDVLAVYKHTRMQQSLVRVTVTSQVFDYFRPWNKNRPMSKEGIGTIIDGNRVVVTANLVENATYIEFEKIVGKEKCPATIEAVDYSANIAILVATEKEFLEDSRTVEILGRPSKVGDKLRIWQFENNGTPVVAEAELKEIEVHPYPYEDFANLVFRVKVLLSQVGGSYTLPVFNFDKLVGMMMSHNQNNQTMTLIPAPVIRHFIKDLDDGEYDGFPRAGLSYSPLEDRQLRQYVGVHNGEGGVYIDKIRPQSSADKGGLKSGDVLLAIDEFAIDKSGDYKDPDYGKLSIAFLTSNRSFAGHERNFSVLRNKKKKDIKIVLQPITSEDYPVPPYVIDKPPEFVVVGGLVFQELSRQYLKSWSRNWKSASPSELRYYEQHQWDLVPPGEKLVILTEVLASAGNAGYESLRHLIVTEVNHQKIARLKDLTAALKNPVNSSLEIRFQQNPKVIYLDAATLEAENQIIQNRYQLPALSRFN